MKTSQSWPITPSTSIGLLILIAVLHIIEDLVQSTIRIIKVLAIAILIILRIKASTSGAKYLCKGLNLVLAAAHPATDQKATAAQDSLEFSLWLILAKRVRDVALNTLFNRGHPSLDANMAGVEGAEPRTQDQDVGIDQTPTNDGTALD